MSNAAAFAALEEHIARVRSIPTVLDAAAPSIAEIIEEEILAAVARGETPAGEKWVPTADGHTPLQHASDSLVVAALGRRIVARLEGRHARHDRGRVKGGRERQILPRKLSPAMLDRTGQLLARRYAEHMRGG